jgi:capsular exopolysaccharide family
MITSSVRGEGKSTTSANLAISLADIGKKTLLVDCDMRKGVTHEYLGIPQAPGLTDILSRNIDPASAMVVTKIKNLTLIPCGTRPMNPSELLASAGMEKLLETLKSRFEIIVLDAPPVLNLPDSCILGKCCDGVILVVQAERTQREDIHHAYSRLLQAHSKVSGFILTNVQYYIPKYVYDYLYGT